MENPKKVLQEFLKHFGVSLKVVCADIEFIKRGNKFIYYELEQGIIFCRKKLISEVKLSLDKEYGIPAVQVRFSDQLFDGHDVLIKDFFKAFVEKHENFKIDVDWVRRRL